VPYVVKGGFGVYPGNNPKKIASTVSELVSDPQRLQAMSDNAKSLSHPEAVKTIACDIGDVLLR
jgi:UDP-N-acetylglucosamine:LPS N-acetylglucosamine transferase